MKQAREIMKEIYCDWRNNYLTPERYAECNGLTLQQAHDVISLSRMIFDSPHPEE